MAADRSLMAWVRTALSLISFGFTIYKLLQSFQQSGGELARDNAPITIGLFLTGLGTASMAAGIFEYLHRLEQIRAYHAVKVVRAPFILAIIMSLFGLFFFLSIVTRLL
jgi:putative membrane protein